MTVDEVTIPIEVVVVPDEVQTESVLVGQTFIELFQIAVMKDHTTLHFTKKNIIQLIKIPPSLDLNDLQ